MVAFLESRFPEVSEFRGNRSRRDAGDEETPAAFNSAEGTWTRRPGAEERIRETLETLIPNEDVRRHALAFLAFAIQNADEERTSAWYLRETEQKLRLMTGRLLACEIARSTMRVGVIGPVSDDVRHALGADAEDDSEFKWIPGGFLITFPIEREVIALPDLQRPFVWEDTKVRDLLDSLFLGFPVGTLVFWHTSNDKDARALGAERPGLRATTLVIDGQQRLTSLYAVMRGLEVVGKDGAMRKITIAFRPRDGRFEVADAAIRNDPEFLPNATELWNGTRSKPQIRRDLITALRDKGRVLDEKYEDAAERNLDRAHAIADYRFPTVDIRKTAATQDEEITEEDVAEIFVRINNQGTRLGQADFVLTLLSVYHGELRDRIEERSRTMSSGTVVGIDTQQLLRAVCGVAFGRARMSAVYRYLRGIDPTTGEADTAGRLERLRQLDDAAKECMDLTPWRDYLLRVKHAGLVSPELIASKNAIVNAYAFYIRGRKARVPKSELDEMISRWVFGSFLTARYSGSSEVSTRCGGRVAAYC